jgi:hypothetical protein
MTTREVVAAANRKNLTRTQTQTLTSTEPTRPTHRTKTSRPDVNPGAQRPSADMPEAPPHRTHERTPTGAPVFTWQRDRAGSPIASTPSYCGS